MKVDTGYTDNPTQASPRIRSLQDFGATIRGVRQGCTPPTYPVMGNPQESHTRTPAKYHGSTMLGVHPSLSLDTTKPNKKTPKTLSAGKSPMHVHHFIGSQVHHDLRKQNHFLNTVSFSVTRGPGRKTIPGGQCISYQYINLGGGFRPFEQSLVKTCFFPQIFRVNI